MNQGCKRVVVLQSNTQAIHYQNNNRNPCDLILPIGPEAIGWCINNHPNFKYLSDLWTQSEYEDTRYESIKKTEKCIDQLNKWSRAKNLNLNIEIGNYFGFQLWNIVGQVNYNRFILRSILINLNPNSLIVYSKKSGEIFLGFRPDPKCIFFEVLVGFKKDIACEIILLDEKEDSFFTINKLIRNFPNYTLDFLRYLKLKLQLINVNQIKYRLLLVGGVYDWLRISKYKKFKAAFKIINWMPIYISSNLFKCDSDVNKILNQATLFPDSGTFDFTYLEKAIVSHEEYFSKNHRKFLKCIENIDVLITSVMTYPWENFIVHLASMKNKPTVLWQHGEKGQGLDETIQYTEVNHISNYFCYSDGVKDYYEKHYSRHNGLDFKTVGSLGKKLSTTGGKNIIYATGKWFYTATPFLKIQDPDKRLYLLQSFILNYLEAVAKNAPVIFKLNNTRGLNCLPHNLVNIIKDSSTPFSDLLQDARVIILDSPSTTLVEACSTKIPIFVVAGRVEYLPEFLNLVKKRVVWCESPIELIEKLKNYLDNGIYESDIDNDEYYMKYCAIRSASEVVDTVSTSLISIAEKFSITHRK